MANILCIECSTEICSIALFENGKLVVLEESEKERSHAEQITLLIQSALTQASLKIGRLQAIAVSNGPGSYTSLRIGASTAKGLAYSLDIPVITLSTLEILAQAVRTQGQNDIEIVPMLDARRMEVYTALFDHNYGRITKDHPVVLDESYLKERTTTTKVLVGNGVAKTKPLWQGRSDIILQPRNSSASLMGSLAEDYFAQGGFADTAYFVPNYIKAARIVPSTKKLL